jgi:hypothetical protein
MALDRRPGIQESWPPSAASPGAPSATTSRKACCRLRMDWAGVIATPQSHRERLLQVQILHGQGLTIAQIREAPAGP